MAKKAYIGVDGVARKVKKGYVGVENFTPRALPSGYTQLSHIESTGSQYFNTGYKAVSENYRIKCKFMVANNAATSVMFGGGASTDTISALMTSDFQLRFYVASGAVSDSFVSFAKSEQHEMECYANNGTFTVNLDGESRSASYSGVINKDYPLFIFANNAAGSASQFSNTCIYVFQIYDNGTMVRDYVPCKNSSGVVGLYDMVNGTFSGSATSTAFVAGSDTQSVARKIKKAYIGIGGVARPCWSGGELAYYGTISGLSKARYYLAATAVGNYAVFGQGTVNGSDQVNTMDAYNESLVRTTGSILAVRCSSATTVGNYALFGGGVISSTTAVSHMRAVSDSLVVSTPTSLSETKHSLSATTVGNYGLFAGGAYGSIGIRNTVDAYNQSLTRAGATALSAGRRDLAATTIGDYALFGGGYYQDHVYNVDTYNKSLTRGYATDLSKARQRLSATSVGNYALFAGGYGEDMAKDTMLKVVDAYDKSLTRSVPTELSIVNQWMAATTVGNYALFGGGYTKNGSQPITAIMNVYDASLTRTVHTSLSVARDLLAATTIGGYALFGGGNTSNSTSYVASEVVDVYTVA